MLSQRKPAVFKLRTIYMLNSTVGEIVWMKKLVPRSSSHLSLRVTEVKLTATDKARTQLVLRRSEQNDFILHHLLPIP